MFVGPERQYQDHFRGFLVRVNLPGGRLEAAKISQVSLASASRPATGRRGSIDAGLAYACMRR